MEQSQPPDHNDPDSVWDFGKGDDSPYSGVMGGFMPFTLSGVVGEMTNANPGDTSVDANDISDLSSPSEDVLGPAGGGTPADDSGDIIVATQSDYEKNMGGDFDYRYGEEVDVFEEFEDEDQEERDAVVEKTTQEADEMQRAREMKEQHEKDAAREKRNEEFRFSPGELAKWVKRRKYEEEKQKKRDAYEEEQQKKRDAYVRGKSRKGPEADDDDGSSTASSGSGSQAPSGSSSRASPKAPGSVGSGTGEEKTGSEQINDILADFTAGDSGGGGGEGMAILAQKMDRMIALLDDLTNNGLRLRA